MCECASIPLVSEAFESTCKRPHPKGLLVVASRAWNSDNTPTERELRKACQVFDAEVVPQPPELVIDDDVAEVEEWA